MSWDILIDDYPQVDSVSDIPDDYVPKSLGSRAALIVKIVGAFPTADFTDPSWGLIDGDGWSIEVNIGKDTECGGIVLHVRGGEGAVAAVSTILRSLDLRAIDVQSSEFFRPESAAENFNRWRSFRDGVLAGYDEPTTPAKAPGFFGRLFGKKS